MSSEVERAMRSAASKVDALMFGLSRSGMSTFEIRGMRLYMRELRALTAEELESALVGFHAASWEHWPDEPTPIMPSRMVPNSVIVGLSGWLP